MIDTISQLTLGQVAGWTAGGMGVVMTALQLSKIEVNPWSWIAKKLGRAINGEMIEKVDKLEQELQNMKQADEEREAKAARLRVLRFGDELIHKIHHSKEHFDDILQDISDYEEYCAKHKDFKNDRLHLTAQLIKDTYRRCMEEHTFI